jgi:hypothetical protein
MYSNLIQVAVYAYGSEYRVIIDDTLFGVFATKEGAIDLVNKYLEQAL